MTEHELPNALDSLDKAIKKVIQVFWLSVILANFLAGLLLGLYLGGLK